MLLGGYKLDLYQSYLGSAFLLELPFKNPLFKKKILCLTQSLNVKSLSPFAAEYVKLLYMALKKSGSSLSNWTYLSNGVTGPCSSGFFSSQILFFFLSVILLYAFY